MAQATVMNERETDVLLLGSSHFARRHHFHENFMEQARTSEHVGVVEISSTSGGHLTSLHLNRVSRFVKDRPPYHPIVIMVMLACNAIRKKPNDLIPLIKIHMDLITLLRPHKNVLLVLCGVLPCPRTHKWTAVPFNAMDTVFQGLAAAYAPNVTFLSVSRHFMTINSDVKKHLFKDGLHLNHVGADILVTEMVKCLHQFVKTECDRCSGQHGPIGPFHTPLF